MKLNCDLGESFGAWTMGMDEAVMPLINQANIACGFHASDPVTMNRTLALAVKYDVEIGAHPAYPDLVGFGRRSMKCTNEELQALIWYQIGALDGVARAHGVQVSYVKPHGALNNDMMRSEEQLATIMKAVSAYGNGLRLMIPVTNNWQQHRKMAAELDLELILEAFADRAYDQNGLLVPRSEAGAVHHDSDRIVAQATILAEKGGLYSIDGQWLQLPAESLCVHGDNPESVQAVADIKAALESCA
ncbi:MAG: 5-oxoprolinase subunit PxpA [Natronospirillum sp.]|uniref:5-oxoprolinase subunit PxpA n=1 Tax=Natronospirillum sp. TaxID=2812955 RepID=UPI0025DE6EBB|nr:5-oxoprolinase subunit PxpA [Natronospirillum sp.]MCH8550728.1 5-oxoprolinase subunit PxpA [Natronospirillum sp.]